MVKFAVLTKEGTKTDKTIEYKGARLEDTTISLAINAQLANRRNSIAHTLEKGEVSGSNKKPWKQKGTGRARVGNKRNPVWRGGGIVFGPRSNRNFTLKVNKKVKQKLLISMLSINAANVYVVDSFEIPSLKTKDAASFLNNFKGQRVELIDVNEKNFKPYRNLESVNTYSLASADVTKMIDERVIIISTEAIETLIKREKESK